MQSPDIPHKTEAGGVRLRLADATAVESAFQEIVASAHRHAAHAELEGVLVQPMARPGIEVIVGMLSDPTWGPLLMVGVGGVTVEVFKDVAYGLAPLRPEDVHRMLMSLKGSALLKGFRGAAPVPLEALTDLVVRLSEFAGAAGGRLAEMELNPVILHLDGSLSVVDALVTLAPPAEEAASHGA